MKIYLITTLICGVTAARFVIPKDKDAVKADVGGFLNKLGPNRNPKLEALKETAQAAAATLEQKAEVAKAQLLTEAPKMLDRVKDNLRVEYGLHGSESLGEGEADDPNEDIMNFKHPTGICSKRDCNRQYHIAETVRWFKKALSDMGVFALENPKATIALFIGVAILASGGSLVPMALDAIGFSARGPVAGSIAAQVQKHLGTVSAGSAFAQLQSAAMGGVAMVEFQKIATVAFAGLGAIGAASLLEAGSNPFGRAADFEPTEWRNWEKGSRVAYNAELADRTARLWGPLTAENCVAYGYREYRAPIRFVPNGADPLEVCFQTHAGIEGVGFRKPLGCADKGPKNGVIATWYVQSNETRCMPHWGKFEHDGCTQYGRRRHFARLQGLHRKDDWNSVCESTPARLRGRDYDAPTYCEDKGVLGIYGVFDVPDVTCECYCDNK